MKKADAAIERLLDRLETDEEGNSLIARLKLREIEREDLRQKLAAAAKPATLKIPTASELEAIYHAQVSRLEDLLTGSDQMVAANSLLRELLGEVRVWGDPEAPDGMAIEIRGEASRIFSPAGRTQKGAQEGAFMLLSQISVVAGARCQRELLCEAWA